MPIAQLWRFLKVGVLNTLFGYALYATLVAIGLQMFVAQIVGTVIAVAFNYFTYSRHVFHAAPTSRMRFVLSYALNYLVSLAALAVAAIVVPSPYLAGLLATLVTAAINFVVLRRFVFAASPDQSAADAVPWLRPAAISE
ncbi:GtrA family protein [Novosphingobium sp.]|uniref:GtrA family protein n=1 Tax=Novosphingobium sp. TaxID=1874826 RepID=UPI0025E3C4E4|nr:GtrA family protein [Novosphingobium sp.]